MLLMCDTGGCEALGVGALTPMQVLGTQREPEGQAMWWDNQVPLMTLVGGEVARKEEPRLGSTKLCWVASGWRGAFCWFLFSFQ